MVAPRFEIGGGFQKVSQAHESRSCGLLEHGCRVLRIWFRRVGFGMSGIYSCRGFENFMFKVGVLRGSGLSRGSVLVYVYFPANTTMVIRTGRSAKWLAA